MAADDSEPPPLPPDSPLTEPPWPSLDRLGVIQALGGLLLGLIALLSSDDHVFFSGRSYPLPQQWGIPCILASMATVFIE